MSQPLDEQPTPTSPGLGLLPAHQVLTKAEVRAGLPKFTPATLSSRFSFNGGPQAQHGSGSMRSLAGKQKEEEEDKPRERGKGCELVEGGVSTVSHQGSWVGLG